MGRWDIVCMLQLHEVQRLQVGADAHFRDEYFIFPFDFFETSIVVLGCRDCAGVLQSSLLLESNRKSMRGGVGCGPSAMFFEVSVLAKWLICNLYLSQRAPTTAAPRCWFKRGCQQITCPRQRRWFKVAVKVAHTYRRDENDVMERERRW